MSEENKKASTGFADFNSQELVDSLSKAIRIFFFAPPVDSGHESDARRLALEMLARGLRVTVESVEVPRAPAKKAIDSELDSYFKENWDSLSVSEKFSILHDQFSEEEV